MNRALALLFSVLLLTPVVLGGVGGAAAAVLDAQTYEVGSDHGLATEEGISTYNEQGVVSTDVSGIDARLTLAQDHEDVGLDAYTTDFNYHYLRIQYNESLDREVSFEVPAEMFTPYPADDVQAQNANVTADLQPVRNGTATRVTVQFTGETDAVFRLSKAASAVFGARDTTSGWIEEVTGYELPSLTSSGDDWTQIPDSAWEESNSTPAIETTDEKLMVQYDASDTPGEERWVSVPECGDEKDYHEVCRFTRDGTDAELLVSKTNETPTVRYRHGQSIIDQGRAAINEILEGLDDLLGGLLN